MDTLGSATAAQSSFSNGLTTSVFAQNFMVRLNVDDLDRWWGSISQKGLDRTYPGVRFSGPTNHPWGREVNLIDLAGVCWHIGQSE